MGKSTTVFGGAITILKNIIQWDGLSPVLWNFKDVWNHQPATINGPFSIAMLVYQRVCHMGVSWIAGYHGGPKKDDFFRHFSAVWQL